MKTLSVRKKKPRKTYAMRCSELLYFSRTAKTAPNLMMLVDQWPDGFYTRCLLTAVRMAARAMVSEELIVSNFNEDYMTEPP